jgi:uncharacterized Fe-S center protein
MAEKVFFFDVRGLAQDDVVRGIERLADAVDLGAKIKKKALVAVKVHFGEKGNTAYVKPPLVRPVVERIRAAGGAPFVTDCNTLYVGSRGHSVDHLITAREHGFTPDAVGAPIVIADGLRGDNTVSVRITGEIFEHVHIGADIVKADGLVCVTHFKGHELSGFGGAIKNLGMGGAGRQGKLAQHSSVSPKVSAKTCIGCGDCVLTCPADAITVDETAAINPEVCIGCGQCILTCPTGSIKIVWNESAESFQKKMAEYCLGALAGKEKVSAFFNVITNVTPQCDCYGFSKPAIVGDVGIVAATDPVAVDQASVDLVNKAPGIKGGDLTSNLEPGQDKFRGVYPNIDWSVQLIHAEKLGLGTRDYTLVEIGK